MKSQSNTNKPIGVFDSGVGGLTVFKSLTQFLPYEKLIYFGDTAHVPYGNKSRSAVCFYSQQAASFLNQQGIKLLILACNTASAFALPLLQKQLSIPVIGVIEPAVSLVKQHSSAKHILILGTHATIHSRVYQKSLQPSLPQAKIQGKSCPLFVPLIEEGMFHHNMMYEAIQMYLRRIACQSVDTVILGCTHYPLIEQQIASYFSKQTKILNSADSCAQATRTCLQKMDLLAQRTRKPQHQFYVSDNPEKFEALASLFLGRRTRATCRLRPSSTPLL